MLAVGEVGKMWPFRKRTDAQSPTITEALVPPAQVGPPEMVMKAYWNDGGSGPSSDAAEEVNLQRACLIWSDEVRGMPGNFFGLIDEQDRTVQFHFDEGIPDDVEDASRLRIVLLDFPRPDLGGSFTRQVAIGEVDRLIETAFRVGADRDYFGDLDFVPW